MYICTPRVQRTLDYTLVDLLDHMSQPLSIVVCVSITPPPTSTLRVPLNKRHLRHGVDAQYWKNVVSLILRNSP